MRASGVSLSFHHMSHHPLTLAAGRLVFVFLLFLLLVSWDFLNPPRVLDLDDRQGFTASSAMQ